MDVGISPDENTWPDNAVVSATGDPSRSCRHARLCISSKNPLDIVLFLFYDAVWEKLH
jgi:hypothetical protein